MDIFQENYIGGRGAPDISWRASIAADEDYIFKLGCDGKLWGIDRQGSVFFGRSSLTAITRNPLL